MHGYGQLPDTAADSAGDRELTIRDQLALQRTVLANERTLLAYGRTAIMLVASGATILKFYHGQVFPMISAWLFIIAGITVAAFGTTRFRKLARSLR